MDLNREIKTEDNSVPKKRGGGQETHEYLEKGMATLTENWHFPFRNSNLF